MNRLEPSVRGYWEARYMIFFKKEEKNSSPVPMYENSLKEERGSFAKALGYL